MIAMNELLERAIDWKKTEISDFVFSAIVDGEEVQLRLNDFPEEPLCTVMWPGGEHDLDDLGDGWTLPKHRGE